MKFYTIKTPFIIQRVFSSYRWRFSSVSKEIYLTFDDGPTSEITTFILNELKKHKAKATFFCIGKNVKKHPTIYERIKKDNILIGKARSIDTTYDYFKDKFIHVFKKKFPLVWYK